MAKKRLPVHLYSVQRLRYALEILTRRDRGITVDLPGIRGRRVKGWFVDEEADLVVLQLEEELPGENDAGGSAK